MADLSYTQATTPVSLVGTTSTGLETNAVNADSSGNLNVIDPSTSATAAAVPAKAAMVGGSDGTNLRAVSVNTSGQIVIAPLTNSSIVKAQLQDNAGTAVVLGQTTMSASLPVTLASNQTALSVSQSGTWTVQQGTPPWSVGGNVASGATDSGNPVKVGGVFNTALPTITNGQRGDIQLDASARQIIAPLTNSSIVKAQLQDNAGTAVVLGQTTMSASLPVAIASNQSSLFTKDVANTSGQNRAQSVTTSAAEALGAGTILANRKFIIITPTNGTIYWGFTSGVTTSNGQPIFTNQSVTISVTDNVHIFVIAGSTIDARISEGS